MRPVYLNRIATAVPASDVHQTFVNYVPRLLETAPKKRAFASMVKRAGIDHRYSVLTASPDATQLDRENFYKPGNFPSTAERMERYKNAAFPLARRAIDILEIKPSEITHVIVTSCTGFYAPGLDLDIIRHYGLRDSVERTIIGFMGCQAAVNGLKAAWHIVRSQPKAKILLVNLELCTLHLKESSDLEEMLSYLIFSDGCAASILSSEAVGMEIKEFRAMVLPQSTDLITWHIGDKGFDMVLSRQVPGAILHGLKTGIAELLNGRHEPEYWAVHPGGSAILDAVETAVGLPNLALKHSREILRQYGNMSSATVMFVLQKILLENQSSKTGCAIAFGPGLSAEAMHFETCPQEAPHSIGRVGHYELEMA